jgi:predicted nucleic acid-binding protein
MKALFDTHVVIDYLTGKPEAKREIEQHQKPLISAVTQLEILGAATQQELPILHAFFAKFEVIACDAGVAELAAGLKQRHGISTESALIWASAKAHSALFITRNADVYPMSEAGIRNPY